MKKLCSVILVSLVALATIFSVKQWSLKGKSEEPIKISAEDLWNEFIADKDNATDRFDGNPISVTGTIAEISEDFMGSPCILLENGVNSIPDGIFCRLQDGFNVHDYQIGDTITVTGTCSLAIHIAGDDTPFISIENAEVENTP